MNKYICDETNLRVGDMAKVVNSGRNYSTYSEWFEINAPELLDRYHMRGYFCNESIGKILCIAKHQDGHDILCAVECRDGVFLIGHTGLEKLETYKVELL